MFVWNTFTNDARVMRECTALAEHGYDVSLICLLDPNNPDCPERETMRGFSVERVKKGLPLLNPVFRILLKLKWFPLALMSVFAIAMMILGHYYILAAGIAFALLAAAAFFFKLPTAVSNFGGMCRMILLGSSKNADVYHANDLNTLFQAYTCARLFRLKTRKKLVYDSHEVQTSRTGYGRGAYIFERFFIKRTDANFSENLTRSTYTAELYNIDPPVPIYNYSRPYSYNDTYDKKINLHALLELDRDVPILLYQGGVQFGRGLDKLVEAAEFIEEGVIVMIGDGREKPGLREKVRQSGLCEKVRFLDKVPLEDLPRYTVNAYLGFQVLNNTCYNHYSASSNKLYEYIFAHVPVVACDFPEIARVVREDDIGILVDSHSPRDIAKAVNFLVRNKASRDKMAGNCAAARSKYSWDDEKHKLLSTYDKLLLHNTQHQPITYQEGHDHEEKAYASGGTESA